MFFKDRRREVREEKRKRDRHLTSHELEILGRGEELDSTRMDHAELCSGCTSKVSAAQENFVLHSSLQPEKKKINKMGRTHPDYLKAITS